MLSSCNSNKNEQNQLKVQAVLNQYKDSVPDFGIVALIDNGTFLDTASIGYSFDKNRISTKNRFCMGSCTKMYTAVAILKLQEKGLLNINDSLFYYLPKHPFIDSTITIKQLLNHTSGIADFLNGGLMNESILNPYGDFSDKVLLDNIVGVSFEKGTRHEYCNTNYLLLAKIIEKVTDKSWEMNIQELILNPLQLKNSFTYFSNSIDNLAHPILDGKDFHSTPKIGIHTISVGSGVIVSDIFDLNTFMRALLIDKTLLSKNSLDLMTSLYTYKTTKWGLGLEEANYGNRIILGHTGRQLSYITYAFVDPKTKESIIVMNNNMNDEIVDKVFEKLCGQK
ncbi:MAG: beta-lactamase family protein [Bacteroidia bacterium]|nr:beta-lactamase family protein [Bacteroidia bacterium]